jgi:hypothetical protein
MLCTFSYESQVVKLVRAIRMGLIKFDKPKEEQRFYPLWRDDSSSTEKANNLAYIPALKPKLPGIDFFFCAKLPGIDIEPSSGF